MNFTFLVLFAIASAAAADECSPVKIAKIPRPIPRHAYPAIEPCLTPHDKSDIDHVPNVFYIGENVDLETRKAHDNVPWDQVGMHILFRYEVMGRIGNGSYGVVIKARDHKNGAMVAIKVGYPGTETEAMSEAAALNRIKRLNPDRGDDMHISIPSHWFIFRGRVMIVSKLRAGDLRRLMFYPAKYDKRENSFTWDWLKQFTKQMLDAIKCMSDADVTHCDLKPANILIYTRDGGPVGKFTCNVVAELADFGLAARKNRASMGTRMYQGPEYLKNIDDEECDFTNYPRSEKADLFSLGMVLLEVIHVGHFYHRDYYYKHRKKFHEDRLTLFWKIYHSTEKIFPNVSDSEKRSFSAFVTWSLAPHPDNRISLEQAFQHEFTRIYITDD